MRRDREELGGTDGEGTHREEGSESGVYRGAPVGPRGPLAAARNAHLKRGRNGRGAPGVFLTRIPDVRASHLLILLPVPPSTSTPSAAPRDPLSSRPLFITIRLLDPLELPSASPSSFFGSRRRRFFLLA